MFNTKSPINDAYIIIGPKNCGKTVFFVTAIDRLQRFANMKNTFNIKLETLITNKFVKDSLTGMSSSKWPAETLPAGNRLDVTVIRKRRPLPNKKAMLVFSEYPGGVFSAAFAKSNANSSPHQNLENAVKQIITETANARGLFLVIDCKTLYQKHLDEELSACLFNLFKHLRNAKEVNKLEKKVAVVFTKMDLIPHDSSFNPMVALEQLDSNCWANLKDDEFDVEFFSVASVSKTKSTDDGHQVPIDNYNSEMSDGLIQPLCWMLDLPIATISGENRFILAIDKILTQVRIALDKIKVFLRKYCRFWRKRQD